MKRKHIWVLNNWEHSELKGRWKDDATERKFRDQKVLKHFWISESSSSPFACFIFCFIYLSIYLFFFSLFFLYNSSFFWSYLCLPLRTFSPFFSHLVSVWNRFSSPTIYSFVLFVFDRRVLFSLQLVFCTLSFRSLFLPFANFSFLFSSSFIISFYLRSFLSLTTPTTISGTLLSQFTWLVPFLPITSVPRGYVPKT